MADLLTFPDGIQRPARAYELRQIGSDGTIRKTARIVARSHADAQRQARTLTDGLRAELWSNGRLIEVLEAGDHPIAHVIHALTSIPDA